MTEQNPTEARQYLGFRIAGEDYGVPILSIREIVRWDTVTRVPSMPRWIRGVMNLRGSVVPVVDLAVKFGLPESAPTRWSCVIIAELPLEGEATHLGLMVDSVSGVSALSPEQIEPPPTFGTRVRAENLLGLGRRERGFQLLLDLERVLAAGDVLEAQEAAAAVEGGEPPPPVPAEAAPPAAAKAP